MIAKIKASLKRLTGRIDKTKLLRDILLVMFALLIGVAAPAFSALLNPLNWPVLLPLLRRPDIFAPLLAVLAYFAFILRFIHRIDAWEDAKADKRHTELMGEIKKLGGGINGDKSEHFTSVL